MPTRVGADGATAAHMIQSPAAYVVMAVLFALGLGYSPRRESARKARRTR